MGSRILLNTKYHKSFDVEMYIKELQLEYKNIRTENVLSQIDILNKFLLEENFHVYLQIFPTYADCIGDLDIPNFYDGRLIVAKELSSVVLEFIYNTQLKNDNYKEFIYNIFAATAVYVSACTPQEMQEYYYDPNEDDIFKYFDNFIAYIDIDNDGSYMNITYDNKKISKDFIESLI